MPSYVEHVKEIHTHANTHAHTYMLYMYKYVCVRVCVCQVLLMCLHECNVKASMLNNLISG